MLWAELGDVKSRWESFRPLQVEPEALGDDYFLWLVASSSTASTTASSSTTTATGAEGGEDDPTG
mgnify:CR=1 FL=1